MIFPGHLRLLLIPFADPCESRRQSLGDLRFHFVESLSHFFLLSLDLNLTHGRDVSLRYLVVVLHVVLQRLVIVVLHLFAGDAADFLEVVGLVVQLRYPNLVPLVQRELRVRTWLHLRQEG